MHHIMDVIALNEVEVGRRARQALTVQLYVEHLALAHTLGVLREIEGQALALVGECEVGTDDIATVIAHVPLAEHARRDVDRHHIGVARVDVLHQSGVTTL